MRAKLFRTSFLRLQIKQSHHSLGFFRIENTLTDHQESEKQKKPTRRLTMFPLKTVFMAKDTTNYSYCPLKTGFAPCVKHRTNSRKCIHRDDVSPLKQYRKAHTKTKQGIKLITNKWLKVSGLFQQLIPDALKKLVKCPSLEMIVLQKAPRKVHFCSEKTSCNLSLHFREKAERKSRTKYRKGKTKLLRVNRELYEKTQAKTDNTNY